MSATAYYGTLLALGMAAVVAFLLCWQWLDRQRREGDLSEEDRAHFASQDIRRWVVAGVMTVIAIGVCLGSRVPSQDGGRPNLVFLEIWLGVFVLVLVLVVLAMVDWLATRRYAQRQRSSIVREGMEILRDEMRLRMVHRFNTHSNESSNGPTPN